MVLMMVEDEGLEVWGVKKKMVAQNMSPMAAERLGTEVTLRLRSFQNRILS